MERIVARKLARDLERITYFLQTREGTKQEKKTKRKQKPKQNKTQKQQQQQNEWENTARFAYDVYKGFQRKEQTLAVAVNLKDAYNRVQFKLMMELIVQYGVSLTLTRWLAAALQERKFAMRFENSPRPNN